MYRIKILTIFYSFWTVSYGTRNFSLHPDFFECEPSLPKPFLNIPVINTKFSDDNFVIIPTITEHTMDESRKGRLQYGTADRGMVTFRQYQILLNMTTVFKQISSVSVGSLSSPCLTSVGFGRCLPFEKYKSA